MTHVMTRRSFVALGASTVASLVSGCGSREGDSPQETPASGNADETVPVADGMAEGTTTEVGDLTDGASQVLVVFYSRADENYGSGGIEVLEVGHTKVMAGYVADALGADTYEIVPAEAYPFGYDECCDQASDELAADARPAIAGEMPDVSGYGTVFVGCPVWWGNEPMVVRTFLDAVDLSDKVIVPFTTHAGSGLGSVPANLQARIPDATFLDGKAVAGTAVDGARDEVVSWAQSLGV